jgi:phage repressor protein C with HTH and peptisase S24 domain
MSRSALTERIILYLKDSGITKYKFYQTMGLSNGFLEKPREISTDKYANMLQKYPDINPEWLLIGKGEMRRSNAGQGNHDLTDGGSGTPNAASQDGEGREATPYRLVPLYNLDAVGGMNKDNSEAGTPEYVERLIPFTGAQAGDVALPVSGNSMYPTYPAGAIILIRKVEDWYSYFGYGHAYVLLLADGRRILKTIQQSRHNERRYVRCVSVNPDFPDEELPRTSIREVFKVIASLNHEGY